jgi:hypothetical protein
VNANPRFTHLLALYAQFDGLTLILCGVAAAAVLIGFLLAGQGSGKYGRFIARLYFGFIITSYVLIMAGTLYIL